MFYAEKRISTGRYVSERESDGVRFLQNGPEPALEQRMNSGGIRFLHKSDVTPALTVG
jgi:hypothetical protein